MSPFILVKASEDRDVEKTFGLGGYPTLVFADSTGKLAHKSIGYVPAFQFAAECAKALKATSSDLPPELQTLIEKKVVVVE